MTDRRISAAAFAALLCLALAASAPAQEKSTGSFRLPAYAKVTLENGLTLYLMEQRQAPLVFVSAVFDAGAVHDGVSAGLASLTAESLLFGAGELDAEAIRELTDFHGASLGSGGSLEAASVSAVFASADAEVFLPLLRDLITAPKFEAEEFEKYKARLRVQLIRAKESPGQVIGDYFNRFVFGQHPYGNAVDGTATSVTGIALDDVRAFHAARYHPATGAIAVVGDFDTKAMEARLRELFAAWKGAGKAQKGSGLSADFRPFNSPRVLLIDKDDSITTTFVIGSLGVPFNHPDRVAIELVNTIFGGRFTSWLNTELRIKTGLTYGAGSDFTSWKLGGIFSAFSFTATDTTERAMELALSQFQRLHSEGIDAETLRSGKNYIKGNFPRQYESPASLAGFLTQMYLYGVDERWINEFVQKLEAVTPEQVKQVIARHFPRENLQFVIAGKAAAIRDLVKKYGSVTELPIADDAFLAR